MTKSLTNAELGIEAVARRSGLSQHIIRIWERRYSVVRPIRTASNRRLYTEADVVRLALLNRAVHAGHRISDIATLPTPKLEQLVGKDFPNPAVTRFKDKGVSPNFIELALNAITKFDFARTGCNSVTR
ncbi:MAG: MerR family transcriptional regulator [bacterium]|nr:MerR family transcriptional regulator [bacterium]